MAQRNTAIRGIQIRDGEIGETQLSISVLASLALADTSLQPADKYTWKGAWLIGTAYAINDVVEHNGSGYIAIDAGTGQDPEATASTYWDLLVEKGATGEQGIQGIQGEQGIQGIQGEKGDKGDTGEQGIQGIQGEKGDKGDKGDTGETGSFDIGDVDGVTIGLATGDILEVLPAGIDLSLCDNATSLFINAGAVPGAVTVDGTTIVKGTADVLEVGRIDASQIDNLADLGIRPADVAVEVVTPLTAEKAYTLDTLAIDASVQVYLNGMLQEEGTGKDYVVSEAGGKTVITFVDDIELDDIVIVHSITDTA